MDTIKNYLENMFINLPCTPEVKKAKQELWQMMEDKYNELKAEGHSENEAIGIVISEFGNLEDLSDALGIHEEVKSHGTYDQDGISVSMEEARRYISDRILYSVRIGLGVMLCICSPIGCIIGSSSMNEKAMIAGVALLFIMIAMAVGLFIYSGIRMEIWREYRHRRILIDFETRNYLIEQQVGYRPLYALFITLGVILCIISVIPVAVVGGLSETPEQAVLGMTAVMFLLVGSGVMLILMGDMRYHAYTTLLGEGRRSNRYYNKGVRMTGTGEKIMSIYWPTVTCIYLITSFLTFDWGTTWIIWPVAGMLSHMIRVLFGQNGE